MSPMEFDQYARGKNFEDLKLSYIPLEMLSEVKETKPVEEFYIPTFAQLGI